MLHRATAEYTILNAVTPLAVTSSTDATPVVVTATSHGFTTGQLVLIYGHTTNLAANGIFRVTRLSANTFSLQDYQTGANIAGSGGGAGSGGICMTAPAVLDVRDWRNVILSVDTSGSANFTAHPSGSLGKLAADVTPSISDTPNFGAAQTKSNPYTFVQIIDLDTAAAVNGATGITSAGTDLHKSYEVNVNAAKYFTVIPTAWSAGAITIKALLSDNL